MGLSDYGVGSWNFGVTLKLPRPFLGVLGFLQARAGSSGYEDPLPFLRVRQKPQRLNHQSTMGVAVFACGLWVLNHERLKTPTRPTRLHRLALKDPLSNLRSTP